MYKIYTKYIKAVKILSEIEINIKYKRMYTLYFCAYIHKYIYLFMMRKINHNLFGMCQRNEYL